MNIILRITIDKCDVNINVVAMINFSFNKINKYIYHYGCEFSLEDMIELRDALNEEIEATK